ncbi:UPF0481 protein At3g47200-like isoform X2 [Ziziphus jujuba]|nr:UPF0481 protein At3g47200-like isoform X2 [Ziziphus jujuba]XP_060670624.1 UPF0481 protein At3g47200-like isoform X2 [Ziziphus jujuba]XP_060670625.1 UPF0481 protein At3g47200-like isoform X2 [Ziziphus jujuba]
MEEQSEAAKEVVINMENTEGPYEDLVDESSTPRSNQEIQEERPKIPEVPDKNEGPAPISKKNEGPLDLPPKLHFMLNQAELSTPRSNQQPERHKIPKLPKMVFYERNCFYPLVVSIGPYHHGYLRLKKFEELKTKLAWKYCKTAGLVDLYERVEKVAREAREFYDMEGLNDIDDEAFTKMMFLDGCFILEFIMLLQGVKEYYDIAIIKKDISKVKRDLFLLENQLPYIVLEALMKGNEEYDLYEWKKGIKNFINMCRRLPPAVKPWMSGVRNYFFWSPQKHKFKSPLHLLDMTRTRFVKQSATLPSRHRHVWDRILDVVRHCMGIRSTPSATSDWYSYHSARVLKSVGIRFRPNKTGRFSDIKFESQMFIGRVLTLPPILIDDYTESLLLNMLAFELSYTNLEYTQVVASYLCFMESLIDDAEDVMILRSQNVIVSCFRTDEEVAHLFAKIASNMVPDPHMYAEAKRGIQKYCNSKFQQWMAECYNTHFTSPWTLLALCGAISVILLTVAQTFLAAWQRKN